MSEMSDLECFRRQLFEPLQFPHAPVDEHQPIEPHNLSAVDRSTKPGLIGSTPPIEAVDHEATDAGLLALLNQQRANHGLSPLRPHLALAKAAVGQAQDQATRNQISHYGSDGSTWFQRCAAAGYPGANPSNVLEDAAAGQTSLEQVVGDWMNSPGHRAAILHPSAQHAGSGSATGTGGWNYFTTDLAWGAPDPTPPTPPPAGPDHMLIGD
jgi:uncharacterized protein YkwD